MLFIAAKILGASAIFFFALAFLNFVLKYTYRTLPGYFKKHPKYAKIHLATMKFFVIIHKWVGIAAVASLDGHAVCMFLETGRLDISGLAAAILFLAQMGLGMYGAWAKPKNRVWLIVHRIIAFSAFAALLVHSILLD